MITSLVGAFYYLRVVKPMYFDDAPQDAVADRRRRVGNFRGTARVQRTLQCACARPVPGPLHDGVAHTPLRARRRCNVGCGGVYCVVGVRRAPTFRSLNQRLFAVIPLNLASKPHGEAKKERLDPASRS